MSSLVLLLLCLSMNACNARQLGPIHKETAGRQVFLFGKDVEKIKLHESSTPSKPRPSIFKELQTKQEEIQNNERKTHESWAGANMMKQMDSKALSKEEEETKGATSSGSARNEIIVSSSSQGNLRQETKLQGWKREARALLVSAPHGAKETVDSVESSTVEDIVSMDYAQPHRKPPIHNEEP